MMIPPRQQGFTLLELLVVVVLVILLFGFSAVRLLPLRGDAEAVHVMGVNGALQSALGMQMSKRAVDGDISFDSLASENPFSWLRVEPGNTVEPGDCFGNPPGSWQWCPGENLLVYRLRYPEYYKKKAFKNEFLRFRTRIETSGGLVHDVRFEAVDGMPEMRGDLEWTQ